MVWSFNIPAYKFTFLSLWIGKECAILFFFRHFNTLKNHGFRNLFGSTVKAFRIWRLNKVFYKIHSPNSYVICICSIYTFMIFVVVGEQPGVACVGFGGCDGGEWLWRREQGGGGCTFEAHSSIYRIVHCQILEQDRNTASVFTCASMERTGNCPSNPGACLLRSWKGYNLGE